MELPAGQIAMRKIINMLLWTLVKKSLSIFHGMTKLRVDVLHNMTTISVVVVLVVTV